MHDVLQHKYKSPYNLITKYDTATSPTIKREGLKFEVKNLTQKVFEGKKKQHRENSGAKSLERERREGLKLKLKANRNGTQLKT